MKSKPVLHIQKFYERVLVSYQQELYTKSKRGQIEASLADRIILRVRQFMKNKWKVLYNVLPNINIQQQISQEIDQTSLKDSNTVYQTEGQQKQEQNSLNVNKVIQQVQDQIKQEQYEVQDQFQFFKQQQPTEKNTLPKQQTHFSPYEEFIKTLINNNSQVPPQPIQQQQQQQDLQQYQELQQLTHCNNQNLKSNQFQHILNYMRNKCKYSIFTIINQQIFRVRSKRSKVPGNIGILTLNLDVILVRQKSYPYRQKFCRIPKAVHLILIDNFVEYLKFRFSQEYQERKNMEMTQK